MFLTFEVDLHFLSGFVMEHLWTVESGLCVFGVLAPGWSFYLDSFGAMGEIDLEPEDYAVWYTLGQNWYWELFLRFDKFIVRDSFYVERYEFNDFAYN